MAFADEDILTVDLGTGAWSLFFDGSLVGLDATDVDAFAFEPDGSLLLNFDTAITVGNLGTVDDSDIVRFVPMNPGDFSSGTFQWYFDGSDVDLTTDAEDIDAIDFAPDGRLLISTRGRLRVPGASGVDEDLAAFAQTGFGQDTAGTWSLYFDGSDVGLNSSSSEDVNGVWVHALPAPEIYLSTLGSFETGGVSGTGADIFICTTGSLGTSTNCTAIRMYWDASNFGWGGEVTDGIQVVKP